MNDDHPDNVAGSERPKLPDSTDPDSPEFVPEVLDRTVIAVPLLKELTQRANKNFDIIIDLHLGYAGGRPAARVRVLELFEYLKKEGLPGMEQYSIEIRAAKTRLSTQYVFAHLHGYLIKRLVQLDNEEKKPAIHKIWTDFEVRAYTSKSISTVKADAARHSFSALGEEITWAVVDSGIDFSHDHFKTFKNKHDSYHLDLVDEKDACMDEFGHGTHVAGIIAGQWPPEQSAFIEPVESKYAVTKFRNSEGLTVFDEQKIERISGMAPKCKLVSLKVLNANGRGLSSSLIAAIEYIQEINGYGRDIKIHGVNLSLGYSFDPEWFACGQSPLCVEVNRLVKSGVVVVAAAGNSGYGYISLDNSKKAASGLPLSINDPGNAEHAITVGSTHRDMPHTYGVSYFSSKGPTGDGRLKPDVVAPGEKIISCAAGQKKTQASGKTATNQCDYIEDSGTSMAAPHVSGVIAAFLSIRREYIGRPEIVKEIFMSTATDLKRDPYFQGKGLVDLMRAIQSV